MGNTRPKVVSHPIGFRLPLADYELFEKIRKEKGMSQTDFIRQLVHDALVGQNEV